MTAQAGAAEETPEEVAVPRVAPPQGRPSTDRFERLTPVEWYAAALDAVKAASHVVCSSYQYDHTGLTNLFLKRLQTRSRDFSLLLPIDKECFKEGTPRGQRKAVLSLKKAGAKVVLCRGSRTAGSMHGKSLVTDRRFAFVGSANFTDKSERNGELLWQLRGMPVLDTLDFLQEECSKGALL